VSAAAPAREGGLDPRFAQPRTLFFGIGAQKSATSWLDKYLRHHPQICLPVRKEQHYWSTRTPGKADARLEWVRTRIAKGRSRGFWERLTRTRRGRNLDRAWVLTETMLEHRSTGHSAYADVLFQIYAGQPVAGEITPEYALLSASDFAEMAALGPDVRFVFIMRDPLDRLRSGIRQKLRKTRGAGSVTPEAVAERMREVIADPKDPALLRSRYDMTIRTIESVVPAERVHYLFFETMFDQSEMDRLAAFLGVSARPAEVGRKVNEGTHAGVGFPEALEAEALETLRPVYEFVRARFGALTPGTWRAPAPAGAASRSATA
jgi:hypothetical protein